MQSKAKNSNGIIVIALSTRSTSIVRNLSIDLISLRTYSAYHPVRLALQPHEPTIRYWVIQVLLYGRTNECHRLFNKEPVRINH